MSALDLNERLTGLIAEIDQVNEETKILTAKRTAALSEHNEATATTIRHQLQELQEHLEDVTFMKIAVEGKLRVYKGNAQKAAGIRKQIAGELWPQGTKVLSKIQQAVADLSNAIQEMDQLNGTMFGLAAEHEKLIGESVPIPMISHLIPQDLRRVVGIKLPELPETLQLKIHSQEIREAQEKRQVDFDKMMTRQKKQILPYLESQGMVWPRCKRCQQELVCMGGSVYAGSKQETGLGGPEVQKAFRLEFRCEGNGSHNGAQGFIRIDGGPYEKVHLTQIELER